MTELQSWRETFEACKAAGLRLPDWSDWTANGKALFDGASECGECVFPDDAALALCRWTCFEWLGYPEISKSRVEEHWYVGENGDGPTIDAAIQAAARAKAATHKPQADDDPNDCADWTPKGM